MAVFLLAAAPGGGQPRIALQYDAALAKADLPSPAARLTINGRTAWFLFDTGAGVHVLASWFVKAAGLEAGDVHGVHGIDSTGKAVALRGLRDLRATLDDGGVMKLGTATVADFPRHHCAPPAPFRQAPKNSARCCEQSCHNYR
jgi:hypothetical protein